ncbi:unnamed protein product [Lota lota]
MWDGILQAELNDQKHKRKRLSVALTVFAVSRYLDAYLGAFLNSSERHFMVGLPVRYYIFTDLYKKVPGLHLGPQQSLEIIRVEGHSRWQEISMTRMKTIADAIESVIRHSSTHVFCMDVDQVFTGRFGSEALGDLVALLHSWLYNVPKAEFTYDRNPKSSAFMLTGDFYYHAAVFGASCASVKAMAKACYQGILRDMENGVETLWHNESHLNKYLWLNSTSKLLSPEYCWDTWPAEGHACHQDTLGTKELQRTAPECLIGAHFRYAVEAKVQ